MIKKIISCIILIMIIFNFNFVNATGFLEEILSGNIKLPEDSNKEETTVPEGENQAPDNNGSNSEDEKTKPEEDDNKDENVGDDNTGTGDNITQEPDNENNTDNKDENSESNTGNNNQENTNKPEQQKPTQNNTGSSNSNIVQKSSEARLKDLKIDAEGLTPDFDKNTFEYYLVVDFSVNKLNITTSTVDNKAKYAIYGNKNLKEGENTVTIKVTAEDGTKKEYSIHVTKVDNIELANAELESLKITGYNLYPSFKSNIYSYNININEDIKELEIDAIPFNEEAVVSIEGNKNLQEGENIIKINVTAANQETIRTYKVNAYIDLNRVEIQKESKAPAIVLIIVLGAGIILMGYVIVMKNKR